MPNGLIQKINLFLTPVKLTDKLFFTKNLKLMIRSGIPLSRALHALSTQTENIKLKAVLLDVNDGIQKGELLSKALERHPRIFSEIFVNMVLAGEESGKLEESLDTLAIQMSKEHTLRSEIKGALAYPIVVLTAMLLVTSGLMIFVIPKLVETLSASGVKLPLPTRILIAVSGFMRHNVLLGIVMLVIGVVAFIQIKKTVIGKRVLHRIVLKTPVVGKLVQKVNLANSCRALSSLLKTDIPVVESFTIVSKLVKNIYYKDALLYVARELKKGTTIHDSMQNYTHLFTTTLVQMIAVGEETGTVDEILEDIAEFYEEELDSNLRNLPSLLEPILILFLGVTIGGIAVSIMMPIFSLTQGGGGG